MNTNESMVAAVRSIEGCGAGASEQLYLDFIGPDETEQMRAEMLSMSSCALVVRGAMRRSSIKHRLLNAPYHIQMAVQNVTDIGREAGALIKGRQEIRDYVPTEGDVVHVFAPEHVYVITKVVKQGDGTYLVDGVEGGQGLHGAHVAHVEHLIDHGKDHRRDGVSGVRDIVGIIDMATVGAIFGDCPDTEQP